MSEWTELGALVLAYGTALAGAVARFNGQINRVEKDAAAARDIIRRDADHARENLRKDLEKRIDAEIAEERLQRTNTMGKMETDFSRVVGKLENCISLVNEKLESLPRINAELVALSRQVDRIQPRGGC